MIYKSLRVTYCISIYWYIVVIDIFVFNTPINLKFLYNNSKGSWHTLEHMRQRSSIVPSTECAFQLVKLFDIGIWPYRVAMSDLLQFDLANEELSSDTWTFKVMPCVALLLLYSGMQFCGSLIFCIYNAALVYNKKMKFYA